MDRAQLIDKLDQIREKLESIEQTKDNRFYLLCDSENSFAVNRFLFEDMKCRFTIATVIDSDHCYEVLYHFAHDQTGCFLTVKAFIRNKEKPSVESIAQFIPGAMWIEREMHDLMGVEFRNHPDMRRLILADDWPEGVYPLRKKPKDEKVN